MYSVVSGLSPLLATEGISGIHKQLAQLNTDTLLSLFKQGQSTTHTTTLIADYLKTVARHLLLGVWSKRRQTKTAKVKTATGQNGD